jgi:hypothetical protein
VPSNAVITAAWVELSQAGNGFSMQSTLSLEDAASPATFNGSSSPHDRWGNRTDFEMSYDWEAGEKDSIHATPSLVAGVQELVNRYGGLDSLALLESSEGTPQGTYHAWRSYDGNPSLAAKLYIEYTVPVTATESVEAVISTGSDDAHDFAGGGWPSYSHSDVSVWSGTPGNSGPAYGGFRWTGLSVPSNAVITAAWVELSQAGNGFSMQSTLSLEDAASPATFNGSSSPHDRWGNRTDFDMSYDWEAGEKDSIHATPSLVAGVQELVNSYGGLNSLVLLESSEGTPQWTYHAWRSYDGNPSLAAKLYIEYTVE